MAKTSERRTTTRRPSAKDGPTASELRLLPDEDPGRGLQGSQPAPAADLGEGKIRSRRITGACRRHQVQIATAVKRAREMALLPYVGER